MECFSSLSWTSQKGRSGQWPELWDLARKCAWIETDVMNFNAVNFAP